MMFIKIALSFILMFGVNDFVSAWAFSQNESLEAQNTFQGQGMAEGESQSEGQLEANVQGERVGMQPRQAGKNKASSPPPSLLNIQPIEGKTAEGSPLYSIELRNVELKDLFRVVARDYHLNFIIDKDVTGKVTASFRGISLEKALKEIASINNLVLEKSGDVTIVKLNLITKVFVLKHIEAKSLLETGTDTGIGSSSSSSTEGSSLSSGTSSSNSGGLSSSSSETSSASEGGNNQQSSEKASTIYDFLSDKGKILLGSEPNSIMVIDYPENVKRIGAYLEMVDKEMASKVFKLKYISAKEIVGENESSNSTGQPSGETSSIGNSSSNSGNSSSNSGDSTLGGNNGL